MKDNNYAVNYEDERFKNVQKEQETAVNKLNETYDNMLSQSDAFYQNQINAVNNYANTQQDLQNQRTNLAIEQINQQKEQANKDYLKEQSGAYVDYTKQSNKYNSNAEQMASNGLLNTGYSESSQVSMYNAYQNRVATARDSYNRAILNYDNSIKEAQLANSSALAEIAFNALQNQLELSLNGFQYKNQLLENQLNAQQTLNNTYYSRWSDVLNQINTENSLAEQIRQYNESMAYQKERDRISDEQWEKQYNLSKKSSSKSSRNSYTLTDGGYNLTDNVEKTYTTKSSPSLSNNKASAYFSQLAGSRALTLAELEDIMYQVNNKYTLTTADRNKIRSLYGV